MREELQESFLAWLNDRFGHEPAEGEVESLLAILGEVPETVVSRERSLWRWFDESCSQRGRRDSLVFALTNNESGFFRESQFFDFLKQELAQKKTPLRVLSAACSAGQEIYSCAIAAKLQNAPVELYGVDLDQAALERALRGRYRPWDLRILSSDLRSRFFSDWQGKEFQLIDEVVDSVVFRRRNILLPFFPQLRGAFDILLLRNVLVHLTQEARMRAAAVLAPLVAPGGVLVCAASEVANLSPPGFEYEEFEGFFVLRSTEENRSDESTLAGSKVELPLRLILGAPPESYLSADPEEGWLVNAVRRFKEGDFSGALTSCATCRIEKPKLAAEEEASMCTVEGLVHYCEGAVEQARSRFERAVAHCQGIFTANYFLGDTCLKAGDWSAAQKAFDRARRASLDGKPLEVDRVFFEGHWDGELAASLSSARLLRCQGWR